MTCRTLLPSLFAALLTAGCLDPVTVGNLDGSNTSGTTGGSSGSCAAAGGTCVSGGAACLGTAVPYPSDGCETVPANPGGFYCCIPTSSSGTTSSGTVGGATGGTTTGTTTGTGPGSACVLTVTPTALDFGSISTGTIVVRMLTLASGGAGPCVITGIAVDPSSDPSFALDAQTPASLTIVAGQSAAISVDFNLNNSNTPSTRQGTLDFSTNDPTQPTVAVPLTAELATNDAGCLTFAQHPLTDCPIGDVELLGQVIDGCTGSTVPSRSFGVIDRLNPSTSAVTDRCGFFDFCLLPGLVATSTSPEVTNAVGYVATLTPVLTPTTSTRMPWPIELQCDTIFPAVTSQLPGFEASAANVYVQVVSETQACPSAGWSFTFQGVDGGALAATTTAFANGLTFAAGDTSTGSGLVVGYNLDPAAAPVTLQATNLAALDGGTGCGALNGQFYQSLALPLAPGAITYVPFPVP